MCQAHQLQMQRSATCASYHGMRKEIFIERMHSTYGEQKRHDQTLQDLTPSISARICQKGPILLEITA